MKTLFKLLPRRLGVETFLLPGPMVLGLLLSARAAKRRFCKGEM